MTKRLLILCFAVFMISSAIAQEASRWRGPTADGKYPDTGVMKQWPADGPEMLWSFE
ncbi:MAG: alcohol dehydrogenase, partial [Bacteroidetes bacterium]|nr:alcohol dehydrogenase [Bacteroidota bacterium]